MSSIESKPQYVEVAAAATKYVEIGVDGSGLHSVQIGWPDAVSSATITLHTSNWPREEVAFDSTSAMHWYDESTAPVPVTITGPSAAAIGGCLVHLGNVGAKRGRLKIVAAATTKLWILPHGKS